MLSGFSATSSGKKGGSPKENETLGDGERWEESGAITTSMAPGMARSVEMSGKP
ncbi:MAG: hypothetical protein ACK4VP_02405 [Nitrospira sp.]